MRVHFVGQTQHRLARPIDEPAALVIPHCCPAFGEIFRSLEWPEHPPPGAVEVPLVEVISGITNDCKALREILGELILRSDGKPTCPVDVTDPALQFRSS